LHACATRAVNKDMTDPLLRGRTATRLVFLFVLGVGTAMLNAQTERVISVDGEAEVQVTPDHVVIAVGVETQGKTAEAALAANAEAIKRIIDLARKTGVAAEDLKTDFIQFQVQHAGGSAIPIEYYVARKSLVVTLRDLTRFEILLTSILTAGATHLHGVDFRTSDLRKHRDAARELAVKAAAEKARDLTAAVGHRINPTPVAITSVQSDSRSWYGSGWNNTWSQRQSQMSQNISLVADAGPASAPLDGSVAFGRISVTAKVSARFAIE
jgi:uncharacterized protein